MFLYHCALPLSLKAEKDKCIFNFIHALKNITTNINLTNETLTELSEISSLN